MRLTHSTFECVQIILQYCYILLMNSKSVKQDHKKRVFAAAADRTRSHGYIAIYL